MSLIYRPIATASTSRTVASIGCPLRTLRIPQSSSARLCGTHNFTSSSFRSQRQVLGRITPKRVVVQLPPGTSFGNGALPKASIWRPILFVILFGGGGYAAAAAYTNYDTAKWSERLGSNSWWRRGTDQPSEREIVRAKKLERVKEVQTSLKSLQDALSSLPQAISTPIVRLYVFTEEYFLNTPPSRVVPVELIAGMGAVFLAWRVGRFEGFMRKWFLHRPVLLGAGGARREWENCVTLFTSAISHQSLPHYAFNSIALFSFGSAAYSYLSLPTPSQLPLPSSTQTPHFLAFLLAGGLISSLGSHLYTNIFRLPRLLTTLASPVRLSSREALAAHQSILPSLGASGAIYSAVTLVALAFPDAGVSLIFVPFFSIPIGWGVTGMVAFDIIGLIRGWKAFDHVAHLSGAAFGLVYYQYGRQVWDWTRRQLGGKERGVASV